MKNLIVAQSKDERFRKVLCACNDFANNRSIHLKQPFEYFNSGLGDSSCPVCDYYRYYRTKEQQVEVENNANR